MDTCCTTAHVATARQFLTIEEKIEILREYKEQLDHESTGVEERIKELEGKRAK